RDALARKLRDAKQREQADTIKKLRRPSSIAWALNQVARSDSNLVESVLAAGTSVKDAFDRGDGAGMREAERSMRTATDAVVDAASGVLSGAGTTPTDDVRSRMASTLRAALVDTDIAERVRSGTLVREAEVAGLGLEGAAIASPRPASTIPERRERRQQEESRRAIRARVAELESTAERLVSRAQRLAGAADRAEEAARAARSESDTAYEEAARAAEVAAAARADLDAGEA
ncbi:MAG TPA: hypothetical protein VF711_06245, partial [Acidimicrobiales bacterium]